MVLFWRLILLLQWLALAAIVGISGYAVALGGQESVRNIFHSALPWLLILLALQVFRSRQFLRRERLPVATSTPAKMDFRRYSSAMAAVVILVLTGILLLSYFRR